MAPQPPPIQHSIRRLAPGEETEAALATLQNSFLNLDFSVWLTPDLEERKALLTGIFTALLSKPESEVLVEATSDLSAVAIWELPSAAKAPEEESAVGDSPAARLFAAIHRASPDRSKHWYLAFLASRGAGAGSALLRHRMAALAAVSAPFCLFTGSPANLTYYRRFGLSCLTRVETDGVAAWWFVGPAAAPAAASAGALFTRPFRPDDAPAVRAFWAAGFMELVDDLTYTLGPVGGPDASAAWPRPALALLAAAGAARAALAAARKEGGARVLAFAAAAAAGAGGLAALHFVTRRMVARMCAQECETGDMADIAARWQVPGERAFFVAEDGAGRVIGSAAVRRGGLREGDGRGKDEGRVCSVWKVSTLRSARGGGVARLLMQAVEEWAASVGAAEVQLMTASSGAKRFYERIGYGLAAGSKQGTQFSVWRKALPST